MGLPLRKLSTDSNDHEWTDSSDHASTDSSDRSLFSRRSRQQFGLFLAGAACLTISSIITRRALARRFTITFPKFFQPSNQRLVEIDGAAEAIEALSIATINVASIGLLATGGTLWALDISNMDDMRQRFGTRFNPDGTRIDIDAEKEAEKWISTVLEMMKKDGKGSESEEKDP